MITITIPSDIRDAIRADDTRILRKRLAAKEHSAVSLRTAAHYSVAAIEYNSPKCLTLFLALSPSLIKKRFKQLGGMSLLHIAAQEGRIDCLRSLIDVGANPNVIAGGGFTPMHILAANGSLRGVKMLINAGASVNKRNPADGNATARDAAIAYGRSRVAKFLEREHVDRGHAPDAPSRR